MSFFGSAELYFLLMLGALSPRNLTFNFAILDKPKQVSGSAMTQDHNLTKPNRTKPNQDILGLFLDLFDQFLGLKYQQVNGFDLGTHIP